MLSNRAAVRGDKPSCINNPYRRHCQAVYRAAVIVGMYLDLRIFISARVSVTGASSPRRTFGPSRVTMAPPLTAMQLSRM